MFVLNIESINCIKCTSIFLPVFQQFLVIHLKIVNFDYFERNISERKNAWESFNILSPIALSIAISVFSISFKGFSFLNNNAANSFSMSYYFFRRG